MRCLKRSGEASLPPWVWVFLFIFPRSLSPAETLKIVTPIERQKDNDNEKENEERAGAAGATWFRPFRFQTLITSGVRMVGTGRRAVRLEVGSRQATLADDPAGRPYLCLFW